MTSAIFTTDCPSCNKFSLKVTDYNGSVILHCLNCPPSRVLVAMAFVAEPNNVVRGPWRKADDAETSFQPDIS